MHNSRPLLGHNRTIHLIDIENLCGTPRPGIAEVAQARSDYLNSVANQHGDHFIVAVNHGAALEAGLGWPGARLRLRSGRDGADTALLDIVHDEDISVRYDGVVFGSGDGIFAAAAAWLAAKGVYVTAAGRPEAMSARLNLASHAVAYLPSIVAAVEAA